MKKQKDETKIANEEAVENEKNRKKTVTKRIILIGCLLVILIIVLSICINPESVTDQMSDVKNSMLEDLGD